jgi:hypothetical protein
MIADLRAIARSGGAATLSDVLLQAAPRHVQMLTRITKDLAFGEFNVCLDGMRGLPASAETFDAFEYRLAHVCAMYERARHSLLDAARLMTGRLRTNLISSIVVRFVEFHRRMYADSFDTESGEYAIAQSIS